MLLIALIVKMSAKSKARNQLLLKDKYEIINKSDEGVNWQTLIDD